MAQIKAKFQFRKSFLAMMIGLGLLPSAHAMQELTDSSLSDTTGEGVALVLDDFKMVFQAPNDASSGSSYARGIANPGQADTGFIRIIPTGENYAQLGERAYNKVYDRVYASSYLNGISANANLYQTTYDNSVSTYKTQNYNATLTAIRNEIGASARSGIMEEYRNSTLMQQYYQQRYEDYYDGTIITGLKSDGTTSHTLTVGQKDKSVEYALKNTYEMIELLYGNKVTTPLNNTWTQQAGTRTNAIDSRVTTVVENATQEKLAIEADRYALIQAKNAVTAMEQAVKASATTAAKEAAMGASVSTLRTKADVFIYGLALSKSDNSLSSRYSNQGFNWGTASNPWLFHAGAETVKQFTDTGKEVGYLALEAPLATVAANEADNNIKLGFWTDIFSRSLNSSNTVDYATGAPTSGLDISERFRAQFIANGLSMNGSQVRLFQTLTSPDLAYSQTLGLASLIRLNTNDDPSTLTSDSNNLNSKGIRISSAAKENNLDGDGPTPALNGSAAPIFHDTEGLYLYSPNINLVLGSMYQPFVVGSEGNNIILEVTRIPKIPDIYNRIYQRYPDGKGGFLGSEALLGSTCNVYTCGTEIKAQASDSIALYQGRDATHSSIAIGSVERIANTNMLKAKDDNNATGVVFRGATDNSMRNFGSAVIDGVLIQHLKIKTTGL
ncbi:MULTISPECIES: hypothetical protein [Acinetobacter]|uniref:Uncharacterized protein n=1 Tax=Acinetobacter variabilis TaxID=70346 RepID=A0A7T7WH98_9GAMM|nr:MULTISPECIES: hypothetical protein [Acinetobacter]QQN87480.1 hypothetical protein IAQ69_11550 [Acinetobacter variabilis]